MLLLLMPVYSFMDKVVIDSSSDFETERIEFPRVVRIYMCSTHSSTLPF